MMDYDVATLADLRQNGSALLLTARCPKQEIDPETGEERDGPVEETTLRVPMSVLREWLKGTD